MCCYCWHHCFLLDVPHHWYRYLKVFRIILFRLLALTATLVLARLGAVAAAGNNVLLLCLLLLLLLRRLVLRRLLLRRLLLRQLRIPFDCTTCQGRVSLYQNQCCNRMAH